MKYLILIFWFPQMFAISMAQENPDTIIYKKIQIGGYIKYLHSSYLLQSNPLITDQLFHNRINLKQRINKSNEWILEIRNRIFYGQLVLFNQAIGKYLTSINPDENKFLNLSLGWESKKGIAALTVLDRAYWQWSPKKWEIRLGRQRVNWGIATIWNPNDIFNAYNFTDFDYEERPSVDGIRIKKYIGYSGSIESVVSIGKNSKDINYGLMYKTNIKTYDLQFLIGHTDTYCSFGAGTAGNLGLAGLKAESTLFVPEHTGKLLNASTLAVDYTFEKGLFISGGILYNSAGASDRDLSSLFNFKLSAQNLYPYKWSGLISLQKGISPLLNSGLVAVYSPVKSHALFINPTISYSIAQSWDLDFVGQIAFNTSNSSYKSPFKGLFLRVKHSY